MSKAKGNYAERKTVHMLEAAGYTAVASKASRGPVDVVGWNRNGTRLIQVKYGGAGLGRLEREALETMPKPPNATVELWYWQKYKREPRITVLA